MQSARFDDEEEEDDDYDDEGENDKEIKMNKWKLWIYKCFSSLHVEH